MKQIDPGRSRAAPRRRFLRAMPSLLALAVLWAVVINAWYPGSSSRLHSLPALGSCLLAAYGLAWAAYWSISRERAAVKIANYAVSTGTLVLLLGLLEIPALLGFDYRRLIPLRRSVLHLVELWQYPWNRWDPELLHVHAPQLHFTGARTGDLVPRFGIASSRGYEVDARYDSRGFRNDHDATHAAVVILGDSFVESQLVQQRDILSTRLAQRLHAEVVNLGQGGYGPQQELVALQRYGVPLQPRFVFWVFFEGNDLADVVRYAGAVAERERYIAELESFHHRSFSRTALLALAGLTAAEPRSAVRHLWNLNGDADEARRRSCRFAPGGGTDEETLYFDSADSPDDAEERAGLDATRTVVLRARELSVAAGAQFVFVYAPAKFRIYRDLCEFPPNSYARDWTVSDLPSRMAAWCTVEGIPYIDVIAPLHTAAARGDLVYFVDDIHWNSRGNEVVSDTLAAFLEAEGWSLASRPEGVTSAMVRDRDAGRP